MVARRRMGSGPRRRRGHDGEKLRQFGHVLGAFPAVLAGGPHMAVAGEAAFGHHAPEAGLGIGAVGLAVFGDVPDMFDGRWRWGGCCGGLVGARAPWSLA